MTAISYPWYQAIISDEISQGDILEDYEIVVDVSGKADDSIAHVNKYNLIIMTQSCDILKKSTTHLVLCPLLSFEELEKSWPEIRDSAEKEKLRKGEIIGLHLLHKSELDEFIRPFRVVYFRRIFEAPKSELQSYVHEKPRLRLLPPYREHLAQAFARFFMRVGLPNDIPSFK